MSEAASESSEYDEQLDTSMTHTVTFKCIGSNHSATFQTALKAITELSGNVKQVPVMIYSEPENPVDSEAISFPAKISGKWHTIGHVVRSIAPCSHGSPREQNYISGVFVGKRHGTMDKKQSWVLSWNQCHNQRAMVFRSGAFCQHKIVITIHQNVGYIIVILSSQK